MIKEQIIKELFSSIDAKDVECFSRFFAVDSIFRFGNQPQVQGQSHITEYVAAFFGSISALRHDVIETWQVAEDTIICQGQVTYTRHNATTLTVPFVNILKLSDAKIREYLIFVDNSSLYQ